MIRYLLLQITGDGVVRLGEYFQADCAIVAKEARKLPKIIGKEREKKQNKSGKAAAAKPHFYSSSTKLLCADAG